MKLAIAAIMLAAFGGVVAVEGATADESSAVSAPADGQRFTLVNRHSGKCLDVPANEAFRGKVLIQWSCHGLASQTFHFDDGQLVHSSSGLCVTGRPSDPLFKNLYLTRCDSSSGPPSTIQDADFTVTRFGDVIHKGHCVDVAYSSTSNGADVILWPCHTGDNQIWSFGRAR